MANRRVGGVIFLKVNGELLQAKGAFSYNIGVNQKEPVIGVDGVHGFTEKPQAAFVEGTITDSDALDLETLLSTRDATITLELANGKTIVLEEAWQSAAGQGSTEAGELEIRFDAIRGRELGA